MHREDSLSKAEQMELGRVAISARKRGMDWKEVERRCKTPRARLWRYMHEAQGKPLPKALTDCQWHEAIALFQGQNPLADPPRAVIDLILWRYVILHTPEHQAQEIRHIYDKVQKATAVLIEFTEGILNNDIDADPLKSSIADLSEGRGLLTQLLPLFPNLRNLGFYLRQFHPVVQHAHHHHNATKRASSAARHLVSELAILWEVQTGKPPPIRTEDPFVQLVQLMQRASGQASNPQTGENIKKLISRWHKTERASS